MSGTADLILELTNARLLCTFNECSTWEGSGGKSYLRMQCCCTVYSSPHNSSLWILCILHLHLFKGSKTCCL